MSCSINISFHGCKSTCRNGHLSLSIYPDNSTLGGSLGRMIEALPLKNVTGDIVVLGGSSKKVEAFVIDLRCGGLIAGYPRDIPAIYIGLEEHTYNGLEKLMHTICAPFAIEDMTSAIERVAHTRQYIDESHIVGKKLKALDFTHSFTLEFIRRNTLRDLFENGVLHVSPKVNDICGKFDEMARTDISHPIADHFRRLDNMMSMLCKGESINMEEFKIIWDRTEEAVNGISCNR